MVGVGIEVGTGLLVGKGGDADVGAAMVAVRVGLGLITTAASLPLPDGGTAAGKSLLPFPDRAAATPIKAPTTANSATTPTTPSIQGRPRLLPLAD